MDDTWESSLWRIFNRRYINKIFTDSLQIQNINKASNYILHDKYPNLYVKWKLIKNSGLYMNIIDNKSKQQIAHVSFHFNLSDEDDGSQSHLKFDLYNDKRCYNNYNTYVNKLNGKIYVKITENPDYVNLTLQIIETTKNGLQEIADIGGLRGGNIIEINIIHIPINKLLENLLGIDVYIKIYLMCSDINRNIEINFIDFYQKISNLFYFIYANEVINDPLINNYAIKFENDLLNILNENKKILLDDFTIFKYNDVIKNDNTKIIDINNKHVGGNKNYYKKYIKYKYKYLSTK